MLNLGKVCQWEDLRTHLIWALSSSASCWSNLEHTDSIAVIYSRLGGCLGVTTKLGPLANRDLWAWVRGLLDKLMIHLSLDLLMHSHLFWGRMPGRPKGGTCLGRANPSCMGRCAVCLGLSACIACVPSWLGTSASYLGSSTVCLGVNPQPGISASCLGKPAF